MDGFVQQAQRDERTLEEAQQREEAAEPERRELESASIHARNSGRTDTA